MRYLFIFYILFLHSSLVKGQDSGWKVIDSTIKNLSKTSLQKSKCKVNILDFGENVHAQIISLWDGDSLILLKHGTADEIKSKKNENDIGKKRLLNQFHLKDIKQIDTYLFYGYIRPDYKEPFLKNTGIIFRNKFYVLKFNPNNDLEVNPEYDYASYLTNAILYKHENLYYLLLFYYYSGSNGTTANFGTVTCYIFNKRKDLVGHYCFNYDYEFTNSIGVFSKGLKLGYVWNDSNYSCSNQMKGYDFSLYKFNLNNGKMEKDIFDFSNSYQLKICIDAEKILLINKKGLR